MANTGFKGIDVLQTGTAIVFKASLKDSGGAKVTGGTTSLYLFEVQSDGTLKSYDWNDNTFKTTALTTASASMTHRTGNNGTYATGVWTYALATLTGFTVGAVYIAQVSNSGASPTEQERELQYGSEQGDAVVTAGATGLAYLQTDVTDWKGATAPAMTGDAYARLGAPAGASVSADVAALKSDLDGGVKVSSYATGQDPATLVSANVTVDGKSLQAALQIVAASVAGKVSGAGTGTEVFKGLDGATTRMTVTADASGNRTAVVYV